MPSFEPGRQLGDLEVVGIIGSGAFSTVYRARDGVLRRTVALKVLRPFDKSEDDGVREKLLEEARLVAELSSPHVVPLFRVHELDEGILAFEMEDMTGGDLTTLLGEDRCLEPSECERVLRAVLLGLRAAHERGIVHQDIKPENILLGRDGAVKLSDFGLGRRVEEERLSTGGLRGTPSYVAPELIMGQASSAASDLWSTGVLLYRMLAGRLPFTTENLEALLYAILNARPAPLPHDTPPRLARIVAACLAKAPGARPASAASLLRRLDERPSATERSSRTAAAAPSSFVGRQSELDTLRARLRSAAEGRGETVIVEGEAGIGKTTLLRATKEAEEAQGCAWIEVRITKLEGLRRPLLEALRHYLERRPDSWITAAQEHDALLPRLLDQLVAAEGASEADAAWSVQGAIIRALLAIAAAGPIVLLIEDVHTADDEDLRLLGVLRSRLEAQPVLLALTRRTEGRASGSSSGGASPSYYQLAVQPGVTTLELGALSSIDVEQLLQLHTGGLALAPSVMVRVIEAAEGIPLYALELFRHLEQTGEIDRKEGRIEPTARFGQAQLPRRLQDMVLQRLQGLDEEDRSLLESAAVAGASFQGRLLAEVIDRPLLEVLRRLQRLYLDRGLLLPMERGFRFSHGLYREVITAVLAPDLLQALHGRWAEVLDQSAYADTVDPEVLGWHWEQAGNHERAGPLLRRAAWMAANRGEKSRAWSLAERAGALDEDASSAQLQDDQGLLLSLAPNYASAAEADRVEALHQRLTAAADELGDVKMARCVTVASSWNEFFRRGASAVDASALSAAAGALPSGTGQADAFWLLGYLARNAGDLPAARDHMQRADAIFAHHNRPDQRANVLGSLAMVCKQDGDLEEAARLHEQAIQLHESTTVGVPNAIARINAGMVEALCGRGEGVADAMEEPIQALERGGQEARAAHARVMQAEVLAGQGHVAEAAGRLAMADAVLRRGVLQGARTALCLEQARLDVARGYLGRARVNLEEASEIAGRDALAERTTWALHQATLHGAVGHGATARQHLEGAIGTSPKPDRVALARYLHHVALLDALGVDLTSLAGGIESWCRGGEPQPPFLERVAGVVDAVLAPSTDATGPKRYEDAAARAQDPRIAWYPAELRVIGQLLSLRAHGPGDDARQRFADVASAVEAARAIEHVWLELAGLRLAQALGWPETSPRVQELTSMLEERNPEDPGLVDRLRGSGILPQG